VTQQHLHIFGGGPLTAVAAEIALEKGWSASLRTSPRLHSEEAPWIQRLRALGCEVVVAAKLADAMAAGRPRQAGDIGLSFGAPWIFTAKWLADWQGLIFNSHARPLPRHRGAGGASWLVMMGERGGMAAIHELTAGVDEGPIVASAPFTYPHEALLPLHFDEEDARHSERLLRSWLPLAFEGQISRKDQDEGGATYWPRLSTDLHGWIDWSWTADEILRFAQAFDAPYSGAKSYLRGKAVPLREAELVDREAYHPFQAGLIFRTFSDRFYVAARGGTLSFTQPGLVRTGDRLVTPQAVLEGARSLRITYLPDGTTRTEAMAPPSADFE
jgi:methionyl-tRNA formyltransferase